MARRPSLTCFRLSYLPRLACFSSASLCTSFETFRQRTELIPRGWDRNLRFRLRAASLTPEPRRLTDVGGAAPRSMFLTEFACAGRRSNCDVLATPGCSNVPNFARMMQCACRFFQLASREKRTCTYERVVCIDIRTLPMAAMAHMFHGFL